MTSSFSFILVNKMTIKIRVFCFYIILDLFAQITNNKNKFVDAGFMQLIYINA